MDRWGWIYHTQTVADTLHISWDQVFDKTIVEFFNVLAYTKDKAAIDKIREKDFLKKYK